MQVNDFCWNFYGYSSSLSNSNFSIAYKSGQSEYRPPLLLFAFWDGDRIIALRTRCGPHQPNAGICGPFGMPEHVNEADGNF